MTGAHGEMTSILTEIEGFTVLFGNCTRMSAGLLLNIAIGLTRTKGVCNMPPSLTRAQVAIFSKTKYIADIVCRKCEHAESIMENCDYYTCHFWNDKRKNGGSYCNFFQLRKPPKPPKRTYTRLPCSIVLDMIPLHLKWTDEELEYRRRRALEHMSYYKDKCPLAYEAAKQNAATFTKEIRRRSNGGLRISL